MNKRNLSLSVVAAATILMIFPTPRHAIAQQLHSGYLVLADIAAPGSPASGFGRFWADSTAHIFKYKNSSGTISQTVVGIANPSDSNCVGYVGTDGVQNRVSCGGGSSAYTDPNGQTWTAFNSGAGGTGTGYRYITGGASVGRNVQGETFAAPATPYHVTVAFNQLMTTTLDSGATVVGGGPYCGVTLYDGTKLESAGFLTLADSSGTGWHQAFNVVDWTDVSTVSGVVGSLPTPEYAGGAGDMIVDIADNGTTRTWSVCMTAAGTVCKTIEAVTRTTFLTPTRVGYLCASNTSNTDPTMYVKSVYVH